HPQGLYLVRPGFKVANTETETDAGKVQEGGHAQGLAGASRVGSSSDSGGDLGHSTTLTISPNTPAVATQNTTSCQIPVNPIATAQIAAADNTDTSDDGYDPNNDSGSDAADDWSSGSDGDTLNADEAGSTQNVPAHPVAHVIPASASNTPSVPTLAQNVPTPQNAAHVTVVHTPVVAGYDYDADDEYDSDDEDGSADELVNG
ncbi:hypothetical protein BDN72DRAFT_903613, partial [Pluteus cervinus]